MSSLNLVELTSRTKAKPMAERKKKWVQKAVPEDRKGVFKEARLAETLMGMSKKRRLRDHYSKKG